MLFDVRVLAFDAHATEDPVEAVVRVFKLERRIAHEVVHHVPRVIKRGVPMETAQRLSEVLARIGARTEIVVAAPAQSANAQEAPREVSPSRVGVPLPALAPALLAPAATKVPANGNARAPRAARASAAQPLLAPPASLFAPLPKPLGDERIIALPKTARSLPEMREPEPLEAELPERDALPPPVHAHVSLPLSGLTEQPEGHDEDSRITRAPVLGRASLANAARPTAEAQASEPSRGAEAENLPESEPSRERLPRNFRPARPAPDLSVEPAPPAPTHAPAQSARTLPGFPAPAEAPPFGSSTPESAPNVRAPSAHALPQLALQGPHLRAKDAVSPETSRLFWTFAFVTAIIGAALSLITFGALPVLLVCAWLGDALMRGSRVRAIQASAVPVGQAQLPELYVCAKQLAMRLDLKRTPRVYVAGCVPSPSAAVVYRGELHVLLDAVSLADHLERNATHVINFMLASEFAHYALGHHKRARLLLARFWPMLRKLDLLNADEVAGRLLGDRVLAYQALLTMLVGVRLATLVDRAELERQAASHERESVVYAPALKGASEHMLARLHHMQHGRYSSG